MEAGAALGARGARSARGGEGKTLAPDAESVANRMPRIVFGPCERAQVVGRDLATGPGRRRRGADPFPARTDSTAMEAVPALERRSAAGSRLSLPPHEASAGIGQRRHQRSDPITAFELTRRLGRAAVDRRAVDGHASATQGGRELLGADVRQMGRGRTAALLPALGGKRVKRVA
jgi:hypothetical protein